MPTHTCASLKVHGGDCTNPILDPAQVYCSDHKDGRAIPRPTISGPRAVAAAPALAAAGTPGWAVSRDNRIEVPHTLEEWLEATEDLVYLMEVCARERTLISFPTPAGQLRALVVPNTGRSEDYPFDVAAVGTVAIGKHPREVSGSMRYLTIKDRHKKLVHPKEAAAIRTVLRAAWETDGPHTPLHDLHDAVDACIRYTEAGGSEDRARDAILRWGTSDFTGPDRARALERIAEGFTGTVQELRTAVTGE